MKKCEINKQLLPIKIHYFLIGAGMSGVIPFLPVLAKQLGISATGVGIIYTVAPVVGLVTKPLFGGLADHFKKIKWMMIFNVISLMIILYCISFLSPIEMLDSDKRNTSCVDCINQSTFTDFNQTLDDLYKLNDSLKDGDLTLSHPTKVSAYVTYQFWVFLVLYVASYALSAILTSLADAACYEMLDGKSHNYGHQRLWGTVGWGAFSIVGGYLITGASVNTPATVDYSPGFYIMVALLVADVAVVATVNVRPSEHSQSILRDVVGLLSCLHIVLFLLSIFCFGVLTGLHWSFLFMYLKDLGASPLLLGLSLGVQCFLGELPTFVFSGMIVRKIGHINSISVAMAAYAIRFLWYSFLWDPWYVLPVEVLHGATFGLFYTAMTSYAKTVAPPGTEATMQGLVGATFECLGLAVGNLIGGVAFDTYGGRLTYRTSGIVAIVCCSLNLLSHCWKGRRSAIQVPVVDNCGLAKTEEDDFGVVAQDHSQMAEKETFLQ